MPEMKISKGSARINNRTLRYQAKSIIKRELIGWSWLFQKAQNKTRKTCLELLPKIGLEPQGHRRPTCVDPKQTGARTGKPHRGRRQGGETPTGAPQGKGGRDPNKGPAGGRGETPKGPTRARGARPQRAPPGEGQQTRNCKNRLLPYLHTVTRPC